MFPFQHLDWDMYDTYEGTDACFICGFLFQGRHHQNDSSSANDGPPFRGAPKGITLNRFPIKDRAQYRDTIFTESSEVFRMCPDSAEMREVGPISSFFLGRRVVDAIGLDGLLLVSGEYDGSAGWMTMLDWDKEEILWDSPTDRKDQWEQVRSTLLGASCVAKVYAREMAFRLCLFSKRSGAPLAEEEVRFGSCTPVTSSICGDTVAVLCVEEESALTCHLQSYILLRREVWRGDEQEDRIPEGPLRLVGEGSPDGQPRVRAALRRVRHGPPAGKVLFRRRQHRHRRPDVLVEPQGRRLIAGVRGGAGGGTAVRRKDAGRGEVGLLGRGQRSRIDGLEQALAACTLLG